MNATARRPCRPAPSPRAARRRSGRPAASRRPRSAASRSMSAAEIEPTRGSRSAPRACSTGDQRGHVRGLGHVAGDDVVRRRFTPTTIVRRLRGRGEVDVREEPAERRGAGHAACRRVGTCRRTPVGVAGDHASTCGASCLAMSTIGAARCRSRRRSCSLVRGAAGRPPSWISATIDFDALRAARARLVDRLDLVVELRPLTPSAVTIVGVPSRVTPMKPILRRRLPDVVRLEDRCRSSRRRRRSPRGSGKSRALERRRRPSSRRRVAAAVLQAAAARAALVELVVADAR